jgi:hypothetical protein
MDKRTLGYLLTIASTILCGLPGLAIFCIGSLGALGVILDTEMPSGDAAYAVGGAAILLCMAVFLMLIPAAAGWWTHKSSASASAAEASLDIGTLPDDF